MPQKMWKYTCCPGGETHWLGSPKCDSCSRPGVFDGWQFSGIEAMGNYQEMHGLKPIGPHRALADRLFAGKTRDCGKCKGKGLITVAKADSWSLCPDCGAIGYIWKCSPDEVNALRDQVLEAFPDAALNGRRALRGKKRKVARSVSRADIASTKRGGFFVAAKNITADRLAAMAEQLGGRESTPTEIEECRHELAKMGLPENKPRAPSIRRGANRRR